METLYRSISQRRLVNPGLLAGPFLPIYGFPAALIIVFSQQFTHLSWQWQFICFMCLGTVLEYAAGYFLERFFHLQLWDYHDRPLNIQGRIALPFSLLWGVLGLVFFYIIHPAVSIHLMRIPLTARTFLSAILIIYFIWDIIHSMLLLHRFEHFVTVFQERYERLEHKPFQTVLSPFRRFLNTYPAMRHTLSEKMDLIYAKQAKLENFLKLQRKKISNRSKRNDTHPLD